MKLSAEMRALADCVQELKTQHRIRSTDAFYFAKAIRGLEELRDEVLRRVPVTEAPTLNLIEAIVIEAAMFVDNLLLLSDALFPGPKRLFHPMQLEPPAWYGLYNQERETNCEPYRVEFDFRRFVVTLFSADVDDVNVAFKHAYADILSGSPYFRFHGSEEELSLDALTKLAFERRDRENSPVLAELIRDRSDGAISSALSTSTDEELRGMDKSFAEQRMRGRLSSLDLSGRRSGLAELYCLYPSSQLFRDAERDMVLTRFETEREILIAYLMEKEFGDLVHAGASARELLCRYEELQRDVRSSHEQAFQLHRSSQGRLGLRKGFRYYEYLQRVMLTHKKWALRYFSA